jgi:hypothetical protein
MCVCVCIFFLSFLFSYRLWGYSGKVASIPTISFPFSQFGIDFPVSVKQTHIVIILMEI